MTYEDVRKRLRETIDYYDRRIKLWENVTFPTKKDGTPFKVFSKNFDGASIGAYTPVEDWAHPYLTVAGFFKEEDGRQTYEKDHMEIFVNPYNKRLPQHSEDRETRPGWGCDIEIMTLDEVKSEISALIKRYKVLKKESEDMMAISEEKFNAVREKLLELKDIIYCKEIVTNSSLEFALQSYVKDFSLYSIK